MNKRQENLVEFLLETPQATIEQIASRFQVSSRTVRNDLKELNLYLSSHNLLPIEVSRGRCICDESFTQIRDLLNQEQLYTFKLTAQERIQIASCILADSEGYMTLADLADRLIVSRQTIIKDLPDIKRLLAASSLEVESKANRGLLVLGLESKKRTLIANTYKQASAMGRKYLGHTLVDSHLLKKIVFEQEKQFDTYLTDTSFEELVRYLTIAVSRIKNNHLLMPADVSPLQNRSYRMAQEIFHYVSQYADLVVNSNEIQALSEVLASCQLISRPPTSSNYLKTQLLTRRFIEKLSIDLGVNLNKDYEFFENLSNHVLSVLTGEEPAYPDSSLLSDLMDRNPQVTKAVSDNLTFFEPLARRELNDNDLEYITIHVLTALEKASASKDPLRVIVVCQAGIGTSRYILQKLRRYFDFILGGTLASHQTGQLVKGDADLVISTVPLPTLPIETVTISPIFSDDDYTKVANAQRQVALHRPKREKLGDAASLIAHVQPVVEKLVPQKADEVNAALRKVIRTFFATPDQESTEVFAPYLHHLLSVDHIQLGIEAADWKDAIRKAAEPLLDRNAIQASYIEAMIHSVEENGPYIVFVPGFAMPHESPDTGALKTDLQLIRLKTPVNFDHDENDPVRYVCCLSAIDHNTHLKAFFNLVSMLQNPQFLPDLDKAQTPEAILRVIEQYEYLL